MEAKRVLFITQEICPYVEDSEMSVHGRQLPVSAHESGKEVRIFMPKWGTVNERRNQLHEVIRLSGMNLIVNDADHPLIIKVASMQGSRLQVYFIDNDDYFMKRLIEKDENEKEYTDNAERAVFYTRGVLETVKKLRWCADVIVCQGWVGALVPFYLKELYQDEPAFRDAKIVFLAEGKELEAQMGQEFIHSIYHKNLPEGVLEALHKDNYTYMDILKLACNYSDGIIMGTDQSSPAAKELFAQSGKPVMPYVANVEEFCATCNAFYDTLTSQDEK